MKKIFIILVLVCCATIAYTQIKVTSAGNIGMGLNSSTTPLSRLSVNTAGAANITTSIEGTGITILDIVNKGFNPGSTSMDFGVGIRITNDKVESGFFDVGVLATTVKATPLNGTKRAAGVVGVGGYASHGYNFGTVGIVEGDKNGAGILGVTSYSGLTSTAGFISSKLAGYFQGNVIVNGTLTGNLVNTSDIRFKKDIVDLDKRSEVLGNLMRLTPVSYHFKQIYSEPQDDTTTERYGYFDEESQLFKKSHFGLIAQDLQKIYPDLVYDGGNGYLAINYTEFIPLLIQSVKEQQQMIHAQSERISELEKLIANMSGTPNMRSGAESNTSSNTLTSLNSANATIAALYQNAPNPFTEQTEIKFSLPESTVSAIIYLFDMNGAMIKQIPVSARQSSVGINGSELAAGMYLYSLIVDGKEVDTKRMILTR